MLLFFRIVEYATRDDMKNAIKKLDGADLNGRKLRLTEEHTSGGGGGGSSRRRRSVCTLWQCGHTVLPLISVL